LDRQSNFRAATCSVCHARRRDEYCEGKGEPVSKEGRVRRFRRAQRVVEKALQGRIREEKLKGHWLKSRERWERGELTEGWGVTREMIESWRKGGKYCEGPYRQWVGYTDPREGSTGVREGLRAEESLAEGLQEEESWECLTDEEGSSTGLQDGWGGFPGESEAWDSPRGEREGSAGGSEAWEGPRESRESSIAPPQE
jgi:hypothetical protein